MNTINDQYYSISDPDVILMLEFKKGNKASFETLMHKYFSRIYNFIFRLLADHQLAEDLTQEVFIKVYNSASRYQPQAKFQTWIYTIAKNLSLNELRKLKKIAYSLEESTQGEENEFTKQFEDKTTVLPDQKLEQKELIQAIQQAIASLPGNQQMAVILRRYENLTYEDIAKALNCSVSAVKSLLSRAKVNLKIKLAQIVKLE